MALTPSSSSPNLLQFPLTTPSTATHYLLFSKLTVSSHLFRSPWAPSLLSSYRSKISAISPIVVSRVKCSAKSTAEEDLLSESETLAAGGGDDDAKVEDQSSVAASRPAGSPRVATSLSESLSLGIREPVYEVVEVTSNGMISTRKINRRQLLKSSGLRPRDIRSVDPSLFLTNSMPSLLVREHAILLNLGSLQAMAMQEHVLIFDYNSKGGKAFIEILLPRLNPKNVNGGPCMAFALEVVEAALLSRIQHLEQRLINLEPRVSMGT